MRRAVLIVVVLAAAGLLFVPGVSIWYESGDGGHCTTCHEMRPSYESWRASAHAKVACVECHGGALTTDASFHMRNVARVRQHATDAVAERPRLREPDVETMTAQCIRCHRSQGASWQAGKHSANFQRIFHDPKHKPDRKLRDDCLRCHGMFFEGPITAVALPDNCENWSARDKERAAKPTMPCLTCHAVHIRGMRTQRMAASPALAFFDRRSMAPMGLKLLTVPAMIDRGRTVKMSPDSRQALCYQCHAPFSTREVFSADDRTPVGVHEGLSCLACHDPHRQSAAASCATCHPRLSNCGLDVEKMDTTFLNLQSRFNIHRVGCLDCHPKGRPQPKRLAGISAPPVR